MAPSRSFNAASAYVSATRKDGANELKKCEPDYASSADFGVSALCEPDISS
jgi:hypothetical protein